MNTTTAHSVERNRAAKAITRTVSLKVSSGSLQGFLDASRTASAWKIRHRDLNNTL
jgi:hypothetical protein